MLTATHVGWDGQLAAQDHPEFWDRLVHVYPRVSVLQHNSQEPVLSPVEI